MLNNDVLCLIYGFMPSAVDVVSASQVCKSWYDASRKDDVWKRFYMQEVDHLNHESVLFESGLRNEYMSIKRKVHQAASSRGLEQVWDFRFREPPQEKIICSRGRHAIIGYKSNSSIIINVLNMDTGALETERKISATRQQLELFAATPDASFVFIHQEKLLHRFDTTTFELQTFDLSPLHPNLNPEGASHFRPRELLPIDGTRIAVVTHTAGVDIMLFSIDLSSIKISWQEQFQANTIRLFGDVIIAYNVLEYIMRGPNYLNGQWSFRISDGHRSQVPGVAFIGMEPIRLLSPRLCIAKYNCKLYEFSNGAFEQLAVIDAPGQQLFAAFRPLLCHFALDDSQVTLLSLTDPKKPKKLNSFYATQVGIPEFILIDPKTFNLITMDNVRVSMWRFSTPEAQNPSPADAASELAQ